MARPSIGERTHTRPGSPETEGASHQRKGEQWQAQLLPQAKEVSPQASHRGSESHTRFSAALHTRRLWDTWLSPASLAQPKPAASSRKARSRPGGPPPHQRFSRGISLHLPAPGHCTVPCGFHTRCPRCCQCAPLPVPLTLPAWSTPSVSHWDPDEEYNHPRRRGTNRT